MGADDLHLGAVLAQQDHLVQHNGVDKHQHDAVEHLFLGAGNRLGHQDDQIKDGHADRHRDMEIFLEHQRGDVHAAGGPAAADHNAQGDADPQAGEDGGQHQVVGEDVVFKQLFPDGQGQRGEEGAGQGGEGKAPAQQDPASHQHHHVDHQQDGGHRQAAEAVGGQGNAGGAAGDQAGGDQKQDHGEGVECIADHKGQNGAEHPERFAAVVHGRHLLDCSMS